MKKKPLNYHEKYQQFYNSKSWLDLRNRKFYDANGLCELCYKDGIVREAREIHHIVPINENWNKRLDYDNLIALCPSHHQEQHNRDSQLQKFLRDWNNL